MRLTTGSRLVSFLEHLFLGLIGDTVSTFFPDNRTEKIYTISVLNFPTQVDIPENKSNKQVRNSPSLVDVQCSL